MVRLSTSRLDHGANARIQTPNFLLAGEGEDEGELAAPKAVTLSFVPEISQRLRREGLALTLVLSPEERKLHPLTWGLPLTEYGG